jgi:hypothetical protein
MLLDVASSMVLSSTNVQWLRQLPGASVAENDLVDTYGFPHPLNHTRVLLRQLVMGAGDDEHLLWWLDIHDENRERVLEAPLARKIHRSFPLRSIRANGPVAYNALFKIKASFRDRDLAKHLYAAEGVLYKKWGVKEIHIVAHDDGLVVWIKKFGFLPRRPGALATVYANWAHRSGVPPVPPARPADYPESFLRSLNSLELYKVVE